MSKDKKNSQKNDDLLFAKEETSSSKNQDDGQKTYKLLIVDDEKEVHVMTKLVLADYVYHGGIGLEFYSAYSGKEANRLLKSHPDAAVILLDVVMETKNAGLDVARFIREKLRNNKLRIILRTGQPGKAPEKDVILNYDINDYKEKTELTTQKLFTTVTTALRSYIHLQELDIKNKEIAAKNARLNEEIARRVVAESNLTKYNRSLEKMIDSKSQRLEQALDALAAKEKELIGANQLTEVGRITQTAIPQLSISGEKLSANLKKIDTYRTQMTQLLEEYKVLQDIIGHKSPEDSKIQQKTQKILKNIDQIKDDIKLKTILKNYPNIIKDSTLGIQHISEAVNDIKMFISISEEPMVETDMIKLLDNAISDTVEKTKGRVNIQKDYATLPPMKIAGNAFRKAFSEIIQNCAEALGSKGIISVDAQCEADRTTINICDNGIGIAQNNQPLVFRPYFTTKKKHRGLGLSFAKSVLIKHNGNIHISSSYREGTTVSVQIKTLAS